MTAAVGTAGKATTEVAYTDWRVVVASMDPTVARTGPIIVVVEHDTRVLR